MELDVDSLLHLHISSDSDDDSNSIIPRRTIDEILNASDSSTSSSSPSSPHSIHQHSDASLARSRTAPQEFSESLKESDAVSQGPVESSKPSPFTRIRDPIWRVSSSSSSSSKQLPILFGGVRSNAKPGAALAAAVAASRSVPTPHAAAIKSRRAGSGVGLQKVTDTDDHEVSSLNAESVGISSESSLSGEKLEFGDYNNGNTMIDFQSDAHENDEDINNKDNESETNNVLEQMDDNPKLEFDENLTKEVIVSGLDEVLDKETVGVSVEENSMVLNADDSYEKSVSSLPGVDQERIIDEELEMDLKKENVANDIHSREDGEKVVAGADNGVGDIASSISDISDLVEERLEELESERINKRAEKNSRAKMKPLDLAEEREKKQASTGLHWEEGAAAQPMRLEGVRRGSTTLGYFDVEANNAITRTISSQAFMRDHGSPQVLAVHLNFIAVGMTKGVIILVHSKYSAHHADNMDPKMVFLGLQGDRSLAPVTSMCFNQPGDLLLAGYGDGHVTVWDVQRASAAKVIGGEHNAPVIHTLFLGQDSQVTRQFKAVTGDSKGLVLLHSLSVVPLLNRFAIKTQCLLDGQRTGTVLSASPLLLESSCVNNLVSSQGNGTFSTSSIGSKVGGVVGGDAGWKLFTEGSSLVEEGVVIFVTYQTALVIKLTPALEVYAQLSRPEGVREGSMPYTAWTCIMQPPGSSSENAPKETAERVSLLALVWDRKVQVAKLVKSDLKLCGKWSLDSSAIGVAWLDDQMMVVLTMTGQLYLFARDGTTIHQTSFAVDGFRGDDLVYQTHFLNVFGNPEKAYHNCITVRGASVYILGPMHLAVCRLLPWKERIQVLRKAGDWMGALNMAITLYDGQAHGVIDLPRNLDAVQEVIMPYLVELLLSYVDEVFSYISVAFGNQIGKIEQPDDPESRNSSVLSEIKEQFTRVGGVAVEFCVHIKRTDILFDDIFSKFVAIHQRDTFLELLEPYILKDMLGCLPPEIMQALVEHYSSKGWLQRVEQCVLHMDISSLDFNQVVILCREHGLYGALVYLFNKGLDDFRAPLEELLVVLRNSLRESASDLGYRMLVYLKYCFTGLAFPPGQGTLQASRLPSLRKELLQFLLEVSYGQGQKSDSTLTFGGAYRNLYYLLELDTEATLDVLKCAFVEYKSLETDSSMAESGDANIDAKNGNDLTAESETILVQHMINALIHVLDNNASQADWLPSNNDNEPLSVWPSKKDIGYLFEFIAYYVACGRAKIPKTVLNQILEYLTFENDSLQSISISSAETSKRREKKLLALLEVVPETDWDHTYLLQLCENGGFYQVCGLIHAIRHQYLAALDSYMKDVEEPIHAFVFINNMLMQLSGGDYTTFRSAVISRIPELVNLSREGTYFLVVYHLNDESSLILSELNSHPKSLFLYLKTVFEVHLTGTLNFSYLREEEVVDVFGGRRKNPSKELQTYLERISDFPKFLRNNPPQVTDDMIELYLELLCQFEPNSVIKFLETFDSYRVEHCLRLCQEYGIVDASAFLLERVGDVGSALLLTLSSLNDKFTELETAVGGVVSKVSLGGSASMEQHFSSVLKMEKVNDIRNVLHSCVVLCQRNTPRLNPEESEMLWFRLLDSFCEPLVGLYCGERVSEKENHVGMLVKSLGSQEEEECIIKWRIPKFHAGCQILRKLFSQFVKEIVEGMIGYVHLPTIMSKLLSDNGTQEFGDFKPTILGMLGTYGFERRILDTAKSLIEDDTFYTLCVLKKGASHGYAPRSLLCCICSTLLSKNSSSFHVFSCGHASHLQCESLEQETSATRGLSSGCPVCLPKKNSKKSRKKTAHTENGLVSSLPFEPVPTHGSTLHPQENDALDISYGLHQLSRYEILSNLQKDQRLSQIDNLPQLRLAPPAIYHEKVKKQSQVLAGESSSHVGAIVKPSKSRQRGELEFKRSSSSLRFPLKSSIFGKEKTSKR